MCWFSVKWRAGVSPLASITSFSASQFGGQLPTHVQLVKRAAAEGATCFKNGNQVGSFARNPTLVEEQTGYERNMPARMLPPHEGLRMGHFLKCRFFVRNELHLPGPALLSNVDSTLM
jgi:hypothetical protein